MTQAPETSGDAYCIKKQVGEYFKVSGPTVDAWEKAGLLPLRIRVGIRRSVWPTPELRAVAELRGAGGSDAEVRSLVLRMADLRKDRAASVVKRAIERLSAAAGAA